MMNLIIETENTYRAGDLENAYNNAMANTGTIKDFISSLKSDMHNTIVGNGSNHIFVSEKNGQRIGMITNI